MGPVYYTGHMVCVCPVYYTGHMVCGRAPRRAGGVQARVGGGARRARAARVARSAQSTAGLLATDGGIKRGPTRSNAVIKHGRRAAPAGRALWRRGGPARRGGRRGKATGANLYSGSAA
jgi:hypothetical protein